MQPVVFLGTGMMGRPMAGRILAGGYRLTVWNRTAERTRQLVEGGAAAAASPREAAEGARVVVSMLTGSPEVAEVLFGTEGALSGAQPGTLFIDMSTTLPSATRDVAQRLTGNGMRFLDAPVLGSLPEAEGGRLSILVGGESTDFEEVRPLLSTMGSHLFHLGPHGAGATGKVVNNLIGGASLAVLAEALLLGQAGGIEAQALLDYLATSGVRSPLMGLKAPGMLERQYPPRFLLRHMAKDLRYAAATAQELGSPALLTALASQFYNAAERMGQGDSDFSAIAEVLRALGPASPRSDPEYG